MARSREWSYFSSYRPTRVLRSDKDPALLLLLLLDSFCVSQLGEGDVGLLMGGSELCVWGGGENVSNH